MNKRGAASQIARSLDTVYIQAVYFIFGLVAVFLANNGPIWKVRPKKCVFRVYKVKYLISSKLKSSKPICNFWFAIYLLA